MTPIDFTTPPPSEATTTAAEYRERVRAYIAGATWTRAELLEMMDALGRGYSIVTAAALVVKTPNDAITEYRAFRDAITSRGFISQDVQAILLDELRVAE